MALLWVFTLWYYNFYSSKVSAYFPVSCVPAALIRPDSFHVLDVMTVSRWSSVLSDLRLLITEFIAALDSSLLDGQDWKNKRLSTLCDRKHLLCLVKYLQQRRGRGSGLVGGQWTASDLFWSANNLSEDKVADPPMLGSLLEGIWSWFFLSARRGGGLGSQTGGRFRGMGGLFLFLEPDLILIWSQSCNISSWLIPSIYYCQ